METEVAEGHSGLLEPADKIEMARRGLGVLALAGESRDREARWRLEVQPAMLGAGW